MTSLRARMIGPAAVAALAVGAALTTGAQAAPLPGSASVAAPVAAPTCARGGACELGDIGPGGGRIIYVRQDIAITRIDVLGAETVQVTTATPHHLRKDSRVTISSVVPAGLGMTDAIVNVVDSATQFHILADKSAYSYVSGGVIKAPRGEWDYIEAAPSGWSGSATDPVATGPLLTSLDASDFGFDFGDGEANTARIRLADPAGTAITDFAYVTGPLSNGWYVPSANEILAMFDLFSATAATIEANGLIPGNYLSSSTGFVDPTFGPLWASADMGRNRDIQVEVGLSTVFGSDPLPVRPVRKVYAHTEQRKIAVAKKVGMGDTVRVASVTPEGVPVTVRALTGSACTVTAPERKNRASFYVVKGGKRTGTCTLAIRAPKTRDYWEMSQRAVITVTR